MAARGRLGVLHRCVRWRVADCTRLLGRIYRVTVRSLDKTKTIYVSFYFRKIIFACERLAVGRQLYTQRCHSVSLEGVHVASRFILCSTCVFVGVHDHVLERRHDNDGRCPRVASIDHFYLTAIAIPVQRIRRRFMKLAPTAIRGIYGTGDHWKWDGESCRSRSGDDGVY